jgi:hypothetical protein
MYFRGTQDEVTRSQCNRKKLDTHRGCPAGARTREEWLQLLAFLLPEPFHLLPVPLIHLTYDMGTVIIAFNM